MPDTEYVNVECTIVTETDMALLIRQEQGLGVQPIETWIPRSLCSHIHKEPRDDNGEREAVVSVAKWKADQENLYYEE